MRLSGPQQNSTIRRLGKAVLLLVAAATVLLLRLHMRCLRLLLKELLLRWLLMLLARCCCLRRHRQWRQSPCTEWVGARFQPQRHCREPALQRLRYTEE